MSPHPGPLPAEREAEPAEREARARGEGAEAEKREAEREERCGNPLGVGAEIGGRKTGNGDRACRNYPPFTTRPDCQTVSGWLKARTFSVGSSVRRSRSAALPDSIVPTSSAIPRRVAA